MATLSIQIDIPDDKVTLVVRALNWHYAKTDGPTTSPMTAGQLQNRLKQEEIDRLKKVVRDYILATPSEIDVDLS